MNRLSKRKKNGPSMSRQLDLERSNRMDKNKCLWQYVDAKYLVMGLLAGIPILLACHIAYSISEDL